MSSVSALTYSDFWKYHGRQSFWLTRNISYRLGAVLALMANRMGLTPHAVTALSFLTGVGGACVVALFPDLPVWLAGLVLFITLHLAYGLDCADGVLARATHRTSKSGVLLDKAADLVGAMVIPGVLGLAAFGAQTSWSDEFWRPFLIWWSTTPRLAMTLLTWLKEGVTPEIDRKGATDVRDHNLFWRLKKFAGNLQDDVVYRSGIALSWATGHYWDFILVFQTFCFLLLVVYAVATFRELADAESS
jgi:phosphatidylglycerophosphate synthase